MNTDYKDKTSKFFTTVYGQFVKDLCYSDFETPVNIFMATFFPDRVTKPFQEAVSNFYHILILKCVLIFVQIYIGKKCNLYLTTNTEMSIKNDANLASNLFRINIL